MTEEEKSRERLLTHKNGIIIEDSTTHEVAQYRKTEVPSEARQGQLLAEPFGIGEVVVAVDVVGAILEARGTATVSAFSMFRRTIGVKPHTLAIITTITAITTVVIFALACPVITRLATLA